MAKLKTAATTAGPATRPDCIVRISVRMVERSIDENFLTSKADDICLPHRPVAATPSGYFSLPQRVSGQFSAVASHGLAGSSYSFSFPAGYARPAPIVLLGSSI